MYAVVVVLWACLLSGWMERASGLACFANLSSFQYHRRLGHTNDNLEYALLNFCLATSDRMFDLTDSAELPLKCLTRCLDYSPLLVKLPSPMLIEIDVL